MAKKTWILKPNGQKILKCFHVIFASLSLGGLFSMAVLGLLKKVPDLQNRKSHYARFAEGVFPRIMKKQKANVDTITAATTTSKCLMKAVENALSSGAVSR